jgi:hypothetical protein
MFLSDQGVTYEQVAEVLTEINPKVFSRGVWVPQIIKAAARFGVKLRARRSYDLEEIDRGILRVAWPDRAHVVLIRNGQLTDPLDQTVWDPDTYLTALAATPTALLVIDHA